MSIAPVGVAILMGVSRNVANSGETRAGKPQKPHARPDWLGARQCYVYIVLPEATCFTTAGRFEIKQDQNGVPYGRFVYCRNYLDNPEATPIDGVQLDKLNDTVYRTTMFDGVFSSLRDASPQRWGRRVIKHTAPAEPHGEIDYMLLSPDDRLGALGFGLIPEPPPPMRKFHKIRDLKRLAALAETMIVKEESLTESNPERIRDMMPFRTSMGGDRPKVVVEDGEGLWLAKLRRGVDRINQARVEHAMLELAKICGICSARSRVETVAGRDVLLVERFDREKTDSGYLRYRTISGFTALRTDSRREERKGWSYALLAEELRRICARPIDDSKELFRRMVFNALTSNKAGSPGNHAIIANHAGWKLSPAYDQMPMKQHDDPERRLLAMDCGIHGRQANAQNLLSECRRFLLSEDEAAATIDAMENLVSNNWYGIARKAGVTEADCEKISDAFAYPGFRYAPK